MAAKCFSLTPQALENIIQCPICFDTDVSLLLPPCQHRICQKCVSEIKKRSKPCGKFLCPNCREEQTGSFPVCRLTEELRNESLPKCLNGGGQQCKASVHCQYCERDVDMRCQNCKKFVCYRCSKQACCGAKKVKHDCVDIEVLESESKSHLKLWEEEVNKKVAAIKLQVSHSHSQVIKLNRDIETMEAVIIELTSNIQTATHTWNSIQDPVEKIKFAGGFNLEDLRRVPKLDSIHRIAALNTDVLVPSPLTRRVYGSDFLKSLQTAPASREKPKGTPTLTDLAASNCPINYQLSFEELQRRRNMNINFFRPVAVPKKAK